MDELHPLSPSSIHYIPSSSPSPSSSHTVRHQVFDKLMHSWTRHFPFRSYIMPLRVEKDPSWVIVFCTDAILPPIFDAKSWIINQPIIIIIINQLGGVGAEGPGCNTMIWVRCLLENLLRIGILWEFTSCVISLMVQVASPSSSSLCFFLFLSTWTSYQAMDVRLDHNSSQEWCTWVWASALLSLRKSARNEFNVNADYGQEPMTLYCEELKPRGPFAGSRITCDDVGWNCKYTPSHT